MANLTDLAPGIATDGVGIFINQSRLASFLRCEVLYWHQYEYEGHGLTPKAVRLALETGSAYHNGMSEYYHKGRDVEAAIEAAHKRFDEGMAKAHLMQAEVADWQADRMLLDVMIMSYHRRYAHDTIEVLAPESSGNVQLGTSPHHLIFRTDALYRQYDVLKIMEYKTKNRTPSALEIGRTHTDIQPTAYTYGVRKATGLPVEGVTYRWAVKNANFGPDKMHLEEWTGRTARDLKRFEDQAIEVCERILARRKDGRWLHNWTQCTVFGECDFRRSCLHHFDPQVLTLYDPRVDDYVDNATKGGPVATSVPQGV